MSGSWWAEPSMRDTFGSWESVIAAEEVAVRVRILTA